MLKPFALPLIYSWKGEYLHHAHLSMKNLNSKSSRPQSRDPG